MSSYEYSKSASAPVVAGAAAILIGLYITSPLMDPDLWWHLTIGRWIVQHQSIPRVEQWNQFALGKPWLAYSWSFETLVGAAEMIFGLQGLLVLQALVALLFSGLSFWIFSKVSSDGFFGSLLGGYVVLSTFTHFSLRPQTIIWIYLLLAIFITSECVRDRVTWRRGTALAFVGMLWANTHLTTAIGAGLVFLWAWRPGGSRDAFRITAAFVAGSLLTPYFGGEWLTLLKKSGHPFEFSAIAEFHPATIMMYAPNFLALQLLVLGLFAHKAPGILRVGQIVCCIGTLLAGLAVVKFLPFASIISAFALADVWRETGGSPFALGPLAEGFHRLRTALGRFFGHGLAFFLFALGFYCFVPVWNQPVDSIIVPKRQVDFMIEKNLPRPFLYEFGHGGYIMYRFQNDRGELDHPVIIDGRTNVVPAEVFKKFMAAFRGSRGWKEYVDLVNPNTVLWHRDSALPSLLLAEGEFCMVFGARDALEEREQVVLVRKTALPSGVECIESVGAGAEGRVDGREGSHER